MAGLNQPAIRVVLGGHIATAQSWSTSYWIRTLTTGPGTVSQAALDTVLGQINTVANTWWTAVKAKVTADTQYDNLSLYFYEAQTLTAALVSKSTFAGVIGTGGTNQVANMSCVISTRSTTPGRSGRGRMYLPATGTGLSSAHQISSADITALTNATQALLTGTNSLTLANPPFISWNCAIASFKTGNLYPISKVTADSIPDLQHRRSDKLIAAATASANV